MSVITLTTDFGTADWFVGTMKGVIAGLAPRVSTIDITHEILPGDIRAGAFSLMAAYRFFPRGTVHIAVVDPGVGSTRAALAVETADYLFVGPDNGVLSWALRKEEIRTVCRLENEKYFRQPVSRTFHGRDIFAPVAAHLSRGVPLRQLGPPHRGLVALDWPRFRRTPRAIQGEVVYIDRFGNAITNLPAEAVASLGSRARVMHAGNRSSCRVEPCYGAVGHGRPAAVIGSSGFLEIAVNGGSAARAFRLKVGTPVRVSWSR